MLFIYNINKFNYVIKYKRKNNSNKYLSSKSGVALSFLLIGIIGTLIIINLKDDSKKGQIFNGFLEEQSEMLEEWSDTSDKFMEDFSKNLGTGLYTTDIFKEMELAHKKMREGFVKYEAFLNDSIRNMNVTYKTSIIRREDEKYLYYELNFQGYDKDEIEITIKDSQLNLNGRYNYIEEKKGEVKKEAAQFISNFSYSFSVPPYIKTLQDSDVIREEGKITVRLRKEESIIVDS